mgnify:CR=1 FL=1
MNQNSIRLKLFFFPLFIKHSERRISHIACQGPVRDGFHHSVVAVQAALLGRLRAGSPDPVVFRVN